MNLPAYIIIRDNNAVVDLNFFLQTINVPDKEHSRWATYRIQELDLVDGKDYIRYKNGAWQRFLVSIATFKQMLRTGRGDTYRQERANLKTAIEQFDSEAVSMPDNLSAFTFETFVTLESEELTPDQLATVPVLLIEGRAAVYGHDLFRRLSEAKPEALTEWMGNKIRKHQLEEGKDYVSFKGGCPGRPMRTTNYVIGIFAAANIANGEPKGKGRAIANYLTYIIQGVLGKGLPATAALADFVGLHPISLDSANDLMTLEPVSYHSYLRPENCYPSPIESVTPEQYTADPTAGKEDDLNVEPLGPDAEPKVHRTPTAEELGYEEQQPDPVAHSEQPANEQPQEFAEEKITVVTLNIYDMLVDMAKNNLQVAHSIHMAVIKMADLYRESQQTAETLSALVGIEQESARAKQGLHRGTAPIPTSTVRDKIRAAVTKRNAVTKETYDEIFKMIYRRLQSNYGISVGDLPREKGDTHLIACERWGVLDQVWAIVDSDAFKAYSVQPAAAK